MMRAYLRYPLAFTLAFLLMNIAARTLGNAQAAHPALDGFRQGCEEKPQPCWYGIVPGETDVNEVMDVLAFAGEPELSKSIFSRDYTLVFSLAESGFYCRVAISFVHDVVTQGELALCNGATLRLGDVVLLLQDEEKIISLPPNEQVFGHVSVNIAGVPNPHSRINLINLLPPNARFQHFPWYGFMPEVRYCQLVPDYPLCG